MAAADYRLMTEATGQRIAAALEALSGFGAYLTTADVVNNLTSTATDKPLSAAMGKALKNSIWDFSTLTTASAGSSATFTLAAGTRCAIFADGVDAGVQGVIIAACNVGGTNAVYNKLGASNLSVSKSATSITIANSASADAQLYAIIWKGSIT